MFKKETNRTCNNTVFPLIRASPLIRVTLLNVTLITNIAISYHYLNHYLPLTIWSKYTGKGAMEILFTFRYLLVWCK